MGSKSNTGPFSLKSCYKPTPVKTPCLKKTLIFFLLVVCLTVTVAGVWTLVTVQGLPDVRSLSDPEGSFTVDVRDWNGRTAPFTVGPRNPSWVPLEEIPLDLQNAVLAGEDFSFYSHKGVDWFELRKSLLKDLRERRFARGASTITQQLAKNLFLSRDKTVKRKVQELALARRMEKTLTKDRILELYLNVFELGDMVYGVGAGARHHFGKKPHELSLRESAFLAAMLPGPKVYDPGQHMDRVMNRSDHLLGVMLKGRMITDDEYLAALMEIPFSEEPSDPVDTELDPESVGDMPPEIEEDPVSEDVVDDEELFTTQDGIIEIPIKSIEE
jgi:monofunctional biosynthetic peptidoglycan transglycosylase